MTAARRTGQLRVYALGVVLDALSLNASIATVAVFDALAFDHLFRNMVATNPEGDVLTSEGDDYVRGVPFDSESVRSFINERPLGQTSAACLALGLEPPTVPDRLTRTATGAAASVAPPRIEGLDERL